MNARGSTEVIVATIGLSMGALSQNLFTMIVAMAVVTTMAMPPMLRWGLARVPLGKAEKERLEREEFEAKGFVSNLERLLLAVDDSANGKFASHIAGLIASRGGLPTTVLPRACQPSNKGEIKQRKRPTRGGRTAEQALEAAAEVVKKTGAEGGRAGAGQVTVRKPPAARSRRRSRAKPRRAMTFCSSGSEHQIEKRRVQSGNRRHGARVRGTAGDRDGTGRASQAAGSMPLQHSGSGCRNRGSRRAAEVAIAIARLRMPDDRALRRQYGGQCEAPRRLRARAAMSRRF